MWELPKFLMLHQTWRISLTSIRCSVISFTSNLRSDHHLQRYCALITITNYYPNNYEIWNRLCILIYYILFWTNHKLLFIELFQFDSLDEVTNWQLALIHSNKVVLTHSRLHTYTTSFSASYSYKVMTSTGSVQKKLFEVKKIMMRLSKARI